MLCAESFLVSAETVTADGTREKDSVTAGEEGELVREEAAVQLASIRSIAGVKSDEEGRMQILDASGALLMALQPAHFPVGAITLFVSAAQLPTFGLAVQGEITFLGF